MSTDTYTGTFDAFVNISNNPNIPIGSPMSIMFSYQDGAPVAITNGATMDYAQQFDVSGQAGPLSFAFPQSATDITIANPNNNANFIIFNGTNQNGENAAASMIFLSHPLSGTTDLTTIFQQLAATQDIPFQTRLTYSFNDTSIEADDVHFTFTEQPDPITTAPEPGAGLMAGFGLAAALTIAALKRGSFRKRVFSMFRSGLQGPGL